MSLMTIDEGYKYKSNLLKKIQGKAGLAWDYVSDGDLGFDSMIFIIHPRLPNQFFQIDLMGIVTKTNIENTPTRLLEAVEKSLTNNPIEPEENLMDYLQRWHNEPFSNDAKIIGEAKNGADLIEKIRQKNSFPEFFSMCQEIVLKTISQENSPTITTKKKL